jgi:hypothetical protein
MTKRSILRAVLLAATMCVACGLARAQRGGGPPPQGMMGPSHLMSSHDMGSHGRMEMFHTVPRIRTYPILSLGGRWWDDKKTVHKLNLRPEQSQRMDAFFESNKDALQTLLNNLQREEQRFVDMPREDLRDETKVFAQIDRIAQARADMEKADFHMLLQIRAQLDPDQLTELDKEIADATVGQ